jgi:STAS domain-containing protein
LAEPLAPQPDAASMPLDDPPRAIRLRGSIGRADVDAVCTRATGAFASADAGSVACDLAGVENPALPVVDVLARLALVGRRSRHRMRLEHASPAILELLALCGLADILRGADPGGEPSGGEVLG